MTSEAEEITEDAKVFGENRLVYCSQHHRIHATGWCTVGIRYKTLLDATDYREAIIEAMQKGLTEAT